MGGETNETANKYYIYFNNTNDGVDAVIYNIQME